MLPWRRQSAFLGAGGGSYAALLLVCGAFPEKARVMKWQLNQTESRCLMVHLAGDHEGSQAQVGLSLPCVADNSDESETSEDSDIDSEASSALFMTVIADVAFSTRGWELQGASFLC